MYLLKSSQNLYFFQTTQTRLFCDCNIVPDGSFTSPLTLTRLLFT